MGEYSHRWRREQWPGRSFFLMTLYFGFSFFAFFRLYKELHAPSRRSRGKPRARRDRWRCYRPRARIDEEKSSSPSYAEAWTRTRDNISTGASLGQSFYRRAVFVCHRPRQYRRRGVLLQVSFRPALQIHLRPDAAPISDRRTRSPAKILLSEGATVESVCYSVGFDSISSFTGLFRRRVGETPAAFQRRELAKQDDIAARPSQVRSQLFHRKTRLERIAIFEK